MDWLPWLIAGGVFLAFAVAVLRQWARDGNDRSDGGFYAADSRRRDDDGDIDGGDGGGDGGGD